LLFHAANVLLLFLLLQWLTGYTWRSVAAAALFAVHPMNVESVAWIAERKTVLCMFFFLLALLAYAYYASKPSLKRYLTLTALFAMSLMSKPMSITLPFVLLLMDYWPLGRLRSNRQVDPEVSDLNGASATRCVAWLITEKLPLLA